MTVSSIILTAYTFAGKWLDARLTYPCLEQAASGRYGFKPENVFINDLSNGKALAKYWPNLRRRAEAGTLETVCMTPAGEDDLPSFTLHLSANRGASCIATLRVPYDPQRMDIPLVQRVRTIAQALISDTRAQFMRGHDYQAWGQLHRERRGHLLMTHSQVDGAYWLTYLCDDYVARLGGESSLLSAPAFQATRLPGGILLQSHATPLQPGDEPRLHELAKLHDYLCSITRPEDRP